MKKKTDWGFNSWIIGMLILIVFGIVTACGSSVPAPSMTPSSPGSNIGSYCDTQYNNRVYYNTGTGDISVIKGCDKTVEGAK